MPRSLDLDRFLAMPEDDLARFLHADGPLEMALPGDGDRRMLVSANGDGYEADLVIGDDRVSGVTCGDLVTLLAFVRQSRL